MAKKKTHKKRAHYTVSHSVHKKKSGRRRRLSAGGGTFKAVSNPIVGGIIGGLAGIVVKNLITKTMAANKNADMIGTLAPVAVGFLIRKKMPFVASGMIAVPAIKYIGTKVPMLAEDMATMEEAGNTSFVSENLLLSDNLYLSDQEWSPVSEPMEEEGVFAEYENLNEYNY